jgi:Ankyrin repeats (3 copies)
MEGMHCAAESGNVELMAWLLQQPGMHLNEEVITLAVFRGRMAMCQYLHAQQCPWGDSAPCQAAKDGHIDILRWLIDNGCPLDAQSMGQSAAEGGSVEVLSYLQQQGLLTSAALLTVMLDLAAVFGKLDAAKWLRAQGAQWPEEFRYYLSAEVMTWAIAEGCTSFMLLEDENV